MKGYYSFKDTAITCQKCFKNGICSGMNLTEGGLNSECSIGYSGRMCDKCIKDPLTGVQYARSGQNSCIICASLEA